MIKLQVDTSGLEAFSKIDFKAVGDAIQHMLIDNMISGGMMSVEKVDKVIIDDDFNPLVVIQRGMTFKYRTYHGRHFNVSKIVVTSSHNYIGLYDEYGQVEGFRIGIEDKGEPIKDLIGRMI